MFTETKGAWKRTAVVRGPHAFGWSVAITGTTAYCASGLRRLLEKWRPDLCVHRETKEAWKQVADLAGSDAVAGGGFGSSVAVSGTTPAVGAPENPNLAGGVSPTSVAISNTTQPLGCAQ